MLTVAVMGSETRAARRPKSRLRRMTTVALALLVVLSGLLLSGCVQPVEARSGPPELVVNGDFERGKDGWRTNQAYTNFSIGPGRSSGSAAVLTSPPGTIAVLNDQQSTVADAVAGDSYRVSAWVRTNLPRLRGAVRIREVRDGSVHSVAKDFDLTTTEWRFVEFGVTALRSGSSFDLNILAKDLAAGQELWIDDVSMRSAGTLRLPRPTPATPSPMVQWKLSNGVALSERGIPGRGALFGAAVGGNADPAPFEAEIGQRLGIRRTYWGPEQMEVAVETARTDLATGRLPWISFKLPYDWDRMAAGDGDDWVRTLATELADLPGPVWIAFHHEPEGDGPIKDWKAMQERLGPIVRQNAPNVAFTVILTGWNQLRGAEKFDLDRIWPQTTVDLAGFDIYNMYGTVKDDKLRLEHTNMKKFYFDPISRWAASKHVAWGLAESGINDVAAADDPDWLQTTFRDLVATGGSAYCYFNSPLNSSAPWVITTRSKTEMFSKVIKTSPTFPVLA